jgi:cytidylate kinase
MAIITISRGTFAGGEKLAALLEQRMGYRTVSRELLYQTVESAHGFKPDELAELLEQAPTIRMVNISERRNRLSLGERRRQLFIVLQASLCELVKDDNVTYHGYAGQLLLPGVSHVVRVRLIGPRLQRVEMAMEREGFTRAQASRKIDQVDSERARWTQSFFGVDWGDPLLFDMVLNLENMSLAEIADLVTHAAALPRFRTTDASLKKIHDLALASRVAARLVSNPATSSLVVDVVADDGVVKLGGMTAKGDIDLVSQVVQKIEGVTGIQLSTGPA